MAVCACSLQAIRKGIDSIRSNILAMLADFLPLNPHRNCELRE